VASRTLRAAWCGRHFDACWALVFQIFFPLMIQRDPSRRAEVRIREVSVPASSSVTPKET
jgi:hypothetical protein